MTYKEAVDYICGIPKFKQNEESTARCKYGNENLSHVLQLMDNPHLSQKTIHIAGTNGKGSTCQFIKHILGNLGYKVAVFTSPHLVSINERFEIYDNILTSRYISDDDFLYVFNVVKNAIDNNIINGGCNLSFFEILFAMSVVYFKKENVDYCIFETGLGGRLDATNLIKPVACAITSIGLDHTEYLGNTIPQIAAEKAGIIKKEVPVIFNTGNNEADTVIENKASEAGSKALNVGKAKYIIDDLADKTIDFSMSTDYYNYDKLRLNTTARYQVANACTAITLCNEIIGEIISDTIIRKSLMDFSFMGRMQMVEQNVYVDGAHNPNAVASFIDTVSSKFKQDKILLFAAAKDKAYSEMVDMLIRSVPFKSVYVTGFYSSRQANPADLKIEFERVKCKYSINEDMNIYTIADTKEAYTSAALKTDGDTVLFCTGSLYLVGIIEEMIRSKHDKL